MPMKGMNRHRLLRLVFVSLFSFLVFVPALVAVNATPVPPPPAPGTESEEETNSLYGGLLKSIKGTAEKSKVYDTRDDADTLGNTISKVTSAFIGFLGVIATFLIIYAGYLWMTAGGDDSKIEKSKNIIKQVIVGFIVLSLAYGIIAYVFYAITIAGSGEVK